MTKTTTVLFCPLEWGLGHTVRLVPLIEYVTQQGHQAILAADGIPLRFLRSRFPNLPFVQMPFFPITYSGKSKFFRHLLWQLPGIIKAVLSNKRQLHNLVKEFEIDLIISDHRYGFHHPEVQSVFITSQLWLKAPGGWRFGEPLAYLIHRWLLRKFTTIWIADYPEAPGLSGQLSHPKRFPKNVRFIDPVSRLQGIEGIRPDHIGDFSVLAIISGPEPQRTLFEEEMIQLLSTSHLTGLLLRGQPPQKPGDYGKPVQKGNLILLNHAPDQHLVWFIQHAETIICRPGISSLSDLVALGRTAILVPTPGQTEQEYMAEQLFKKGLFDLHRQGEISLKNMISKNTAHLPTPDSGKWQKEIDQILNSINPV